MATEEFALEIADAPRPRFWMAVLANFVSQSMSVRDGGGRRAVFTLRASGEVVREFSESFIGSSESGYETVLADYSTMTAENFQNTWLTPAV